jgi:hypothetical protein
MHCAKCNSTFCWLCMQRINNANPYDHFNNTKSKCYNQLFAGVDINAMDDDGDGEWDDDRGGGGWGDEPPQLLGWINMQE